MSRVIIDTLVYKDVPYNEYYRDKHTPLGLIFIQHGFQSSKEYGADYLALTLAREGYKVVSIDAYKHGDRIEEPYIDGDIQLRYSELFSVVDHTSSDIVMLYEDVYKEEFSYFDLIGVSMGGFIAFSTLMKTSRIRKVVPVITTVKLYKLAIKGPDLEDRSLYDLEIQRNLDYIKKIDPFHNVDQFKFKEMFILNCIHDPLIDYHDNEEFVKQANDESITMKLYDDVHEVNREMQLDIFEYIKKR
jgi:esterase/lipase